MAVYIFESNQDNVDEFIQFYTLQRFFEFVSRGAEKASACPIYGFCKANGDICNEQCNRNLQFEQIKSVRILGFVRTAAIPSP